MAANGGYPWQVRLRGFRFPNVEHLECRRLFSAGSVNIHFGSKGSLTVPLEGEVVDLVGQAALPGGGILIAGNDQLVKHNVDDPGFIIEITPKGKLDTAFGSGGILRINSTSDAANQFTGMIVQPNGEVIVSSEDANLRAFSSATGAVETGFGTDGVAATPASGLLASGPDNTFYLGRPSSGYTGFQLSAYSATGTLIHTGVVSAGTQSTQVDEIASGGNEVVLSGPLGSGSGGVGVALFNSSGDPVTTFGTSGLVSEVLDYSNTALGLGINSGGQVLTSTLVAPKKSKLLNKYSDVVTEQSTRGKVEKSFGKKGNAVLSGVFDIGKIPPFTNNLAIQGNGRIVVSNYALAGSKNDLLLTRFKSTGALDTSFGVKGTVETTSALEVPQLVELDASGNLDVLSSELSAQDLVFTQFLYA